MFFILFSRTHITIMKDTEKISQYDEDLHRRILDGASFEELVADVKDPYLVRRVFEDVKADLDQSFWKEHYSRSSNDKNAPVPIDESLEDS